MFPPDPNQLPPQDLSAPMQSQDSPVGDPSSMPPVLGTQGVQPSVDVGSPILPQEDAPVPEALVSESDEARILNRLMDDYLEQEQGARDTNMKEWRKHLNYWDGLQYTAWDVGSQQWKTPDQILDEDPQADLDPALYAKVVNVYKAHGEILIGALSAGVPTVRFFPLDADDHEDVSAAKAFSKIAELIQRHNKAKLLLMKALYLLYNCGMVACYNENKADFRFGSYKTPVFDDIPILQRDTFCPSCGNDMGQEQLPAEGMPAPPGPIQCPQCGYQGVPEVNDQPSTIPMQTGEVDNPKNRECLEIYGPLNVRLPLYVKELISTPYICLEDEFPVALLRHIYPEYAEKIMSSKLSSYNSELRVPSVYKGDSPDDMVLVQRFWFQPWALNLYLNRDDEIIKGLQTAYPDGIYIVRINEDLIVEIVKDSLDKHWTIAENPLAESLHAPPIGRQMIPLQDIENELDNLTLETIEYGLPELFADPKVLDFTAYQRQELRPGQVSPANAPGGRSLGEGFFELKAATLSREVDMFANRMNERQQFVQGTYPSIYGGTQEGGSGTAREYELSKASALQRLATTWAILQEWWADVMAKSARSFVKNMKSDEKMVQSKGSNFVNVWIRQAELVGSVGEVTPEIAEPFPISWTQRRDVLLNLMQMKDENVSAVIAHPENSGLVAAVIGLPDLHIPGDDSRNKQLYEISQLVMAEPMPGGGMGPDGQPIFMPSIPVDPVVDDSMVEAEICKSWLRSPVGIDAKSSNPGGYMNVVAHLKMHEFFNMQAAMAQAQQEAQASGNDNQSADNTQSEGAVE